MVSDVHLEQQVGAIRDERAESIAIDAAILVLKGWSREEAVEKAASVLYHQNEADNDITGVKATLEEAQSPELDSSNTKKAQIQAIAGELLDMAYDAADKYNL